MTEIEKMVTELFANAPRSVAVRIVERKTDFPVLYSPYSGRWEIQGYLEHCPDDERGLPAVDYPGLHERPILGGDEVSEIVVVARLTGKGGKIGNVAWVHKVGDPVWPPFALPAEEREMRETAVDMSPLTK